MMTGASRLAKEKRAFVNFSASPNHCLKNREIRYLLGTKFVRRIVIVHMDDPDFQEIKQILYLINCSKSVEDQISQFSALR
jgi:hypothetical protein